MKLRALQVKFNLLGERWAPFIFLTALLICKRFKVKKKKIKIKKYRIFTCSFTLSIVVFVDAFPKKKNDLIWLMNWRISGFTAFCIYRNLIDMVAYLILPVAMKR